MTLKPKSNLCETCGLNMKAPIGSRCQKCVAAERSARESGYPTDGPNQRRRYEERNGRHGVGNLIRRIAEREALLARYIGTEIPTQQEDIGDD